MSVIIIGISQYPAWLHLLISMITISPTYLLETLSGLVAIDSSNPSLAPDGAGERHIAAYLADLFHELGMQIDWCEAVPGRPSVIGRLPGAGGPALMLNAHLDTVGAGGMAQPFIPQVRGGRLYGRGAQDMKGSLAAVKALVDAGRQPSGDLLIAAVADEEYTSLGTSQVIDRLAERGDLPALAIVTEPTAMRIALAHRGFTWMKIETSGQAAHGSRWWEGVDANRHMGRLLDELDSLAHELIQRPPHALVGPPSLHTPLLQGGSEMSIYAARCTLHIERRNLPGETEGQIESEIQSILDRLAAADPHFQAGLETWFARPAFEARPDSALLPLLSQAYTAVMGAAPTTVGVPFWTDAALLAAAGVDTLLLGPTGAGLHTDEEWVDIDSCARLAAILAETAISHSPETRR